MTDHKADSPKPESPKTDNPIKTPTGDKSLSPGVGGAVSDWNPNHHPLDGSPVLTAIPQYKPQPGQTGAKPKTVAQHNAEILEMADARATGNRSKQE